MRRLMSALGLAIVLGATTSACVVREQRVATGPGRCRGAYWVEGHYGPRGHWHHAHWRCPGDADVIEIY